MRTCCASDDHKPHLLTCKNGKTQVRVLSFGAGTQSSAVLGLIEEGKLPPVDFAVFADTQCEPKEVYEWLDKITAWAKKTRIIVATKGNLMQDLLDAIKSKGRTVLPPLYTKRTIDKAIFADDENEFGDLVVVGSSREEEEGILNRKCTADYKIEVIRQAIKKELGYKPRQRVTKHHVHTLIAMSLEETMRMKDSREYWLTNEYPLIFDVPMHRQQSIEYVKSLGIGTPPRSSCLICPFHSNAEWKRIRDNNAAEYERACQFDEAIRHIPRMRSETFLHQSRKPLREVNLDEQSDQLDLFLNECEGMCGA